MNCIKPRDIYVHTRFVAVPCGRCIPCLMNRRVDWSLRLQEEHKASSSAYFVTLTYDQKHLSSDQSLDKTHVQLYLKRLRKKDGTNRIRYFAVGEYGSKSFRPHYHLLLFNAQESDVRACWRDHNGRPIGFVHVGNVTGASVAYCLKYIVQPEVIVEGRQRPFALMSRKYGIGAMYLTDAMLRWHREDDRNYVLLPGNIKSRLPRFYREKIWPLVKDRSRFVGHWMVDRKRVSESSMALSLGNQEKERQYYKDAHGVDWESVMLVSRDVMLQRVKTKVAFTQTI